MMCKVKHLPIRTGSAVCLAESLGCIRCRSAAQETAPVASRSIPSVDNRLGAERRLVNNLYPPFGGEGNPKNPGSNPEPVAPSDSLCVRMMWRKAFLSTIVLLTEVKLASSGLRTARCSRMRSLGIRRHFASPRVSSGLSTLKGIGTWPRIRAHRYRC
jgi:hypothetical protein